MKKKKINKRRKIGKKKKIVHLDRKIIAFLHKSTTPQTVKDIFKGVKLDTKELKHQAVQILRNFLSKEIITEHQHGQYSLSKTPNSLIGKVQVNPSGSGYFLKDDGDDIFISKKNLGQALHHDVVEVLVIPNREGKRQEAQIIRVVERAKKTYIGVVRMHRKNAFVETQRIGKDFFITEKNLNNAQEGDKVEVKMTSWPNDAKNPYGAIISNFGKPGSIECEVQGTLAEFGLPYAFPEEVENEAKKFSEELTEDDLKSRRDFRDITTFTIDPHDAKDFDDALSIKEIDKDLWEIGVHIADVSYYLDQSPILEKEAQERATSIYLVDRVVPMLPESLSNGLCSLRPNETKRTFSVCFTINKRGTIKDYWIGRTLIHSDRRFTYEEAQEIIETKKGDYSKEILILDKIAKTLRKKRMNNGAIAFDREEMRFRLDEENNPIGVYTKKSLDANKLIEEFMLLANKTVGESIGKVKAKKDIRTFVYRIHDKPDQEKLQHFSDFVNKIGFNFTLSENNINKSLNQVLSESYQTPFAEMVEIIAMRSMSKAKYSTANIGHYGLGFSHYSHFTSPIRRYPDVMAHRLIQHYLDGGASVPTEHYENLCKHSSDMEKLAVDAERSSIKFMQVKFMEDKVGQVFEATINGVTDRGIYAEIIENKCEGMIRLTSIKSDYFMAFPDEFFIRGSQSKKVYRFGDKIKVEIIKTDLEKKHIDMILIED
jgi:ribonuclease R